MKKFLIRAVTGLIYAAVVVLSIVFYGVSSFSCLALDLLFLFFALLGVWECFRMAQNLDAQPQRITALLLSVMLLLAPMFLSFCENIDPPTILSAGFEGMVLCVMCLPFAIEIFRNRPNPLLNVSVTLLPVLWVALPFSLAIRLATFCPQLLLSIFILLWVNDTLAYCVGSLFGRHKLCERISPNKSVEGFLGALVLTSGASIAFSFIPYFSNSIIVSPLEWLGFSLIVILSGTLGDLAESLFKRNCGVKDSGNILPGHGGILDRMDSALLAIPFAILYILLLISF